MQIPVLIEENNKTHLVSQQELAQLLPQAKQIFANNFSQEVYFERSVFINWTCAIADCKYCYLSTKPKFNPSKGTKAIRSQESVLAEVLVCKIMGWRVGYITGGLRVESAQYLIDLVTKINTITKEKIMMNFGPYSRNIIEKFEPHIAGMGSAIESFDEELHNYICPSKPLKSLLKFLEDLGDLKLKKLITIILGMGERKEDVEVVIENIKKYNIDKIQLCFLKPQENTIFQNVPSPDPLYMAYWISKIRIACPQIIIKVALVKERINDLSLYLEAGANGFTRFMVFSDFATKNAQALEEECRRAKRVLLGSFTTLPIVDLKKEVEELSFSSDLKARILPKALEYWKSLEDNTKSLDH